jgi:protein MpaA
MPDINNKSSIAVVFLNLFVVLVLTGCYRPMPEPEIVMGPESLLGEITVQRHIVGRSIEHRPIEYLVLGAGKDVTFILASIHGNEPAGTPLVRSLEEHLQLHPQLMQGRKVVLLPVANPDGLAHNSRNNARGIDLNRNFAAANRVKSSSSGYRALSEPEARVIERLIRQYAPDRIVSIHQPLACIDYDGPAYPLAVRMALYCGLPVKKLGAKPGSLGSYAGISRGIPIITLELPGDASRLNRQSLWQRYGTALLAAVVYPNNPTAIKGLKRSF